MRNPIQNNSRQTGISLPVVLILLVPLTLLAVMIASRNNLEELMAAAQRDGQQSLMNAESGLALAQKTLERVDAGTYTSNLNQVLATGSIDINSYSLTEGTVTAIVRDNYEPEEMINPGFQEPFIDVDGRVVVTSTGFYQGGERVVEAIFFLPRSGQSTTDDPPLVIFSEDDLTISGNPFIWGPNANVHTNSSMIISGNPEIWGNVTALDGFDISGSPIDENGDPIQAIVVAEAIPTPYVYPPAYKPFATYYLTADCDVYDRWPNHPDQTLPAATLIINDVKNNGPWNGWNCDYNKEWKMDTGDWITGFFYVEANVTISANPGEGDLTPARFSVVAEGNIEVSGNPFIQPYYADAPEFDIDDEYVQDLIGIRTNVLLTNEVLFYAGNDLKLNGNPEQNFTGVMAAHMEFDISGNPNLKGAVIAENGAAQERDFNIAEGYQEVSSGRDVKNIVDLNSISGAPTITDGSDGDDSSPPDPEVPAAAIIQAWREVVE